MAEPQYRSREQRVIERSEKTKTSHRSAVVSRIANRTWNH